MEEINTYSYSKIKCFLNCPLSFYKQYYDKPDDKISHGTSEFGSFMHYILEQYEKGELETYELLPYYINNYDDNVTSDFTLVINENFSKNFAETYFQSGKDYLENFEGFPTLKVIEVEYAFTECIDNKFNFTGKIDLIAEDENGDLIILDHKSKNGFKSKAEKAEYAVQLYLYAYAVYKKYGKFPKKLMFNMFRQDKFEIFDFDMDEYNNAMDWLNNMVEEIEETFSFPSVLGTFFCNNFCNYRNECEEKEGNNDII